MTRKAISMAVVAATVAGAVLPSATMAQGYDRSGSTYDRGYRDGYYSRNASWEDRHYRGRYRYYHHRCGGGDGAVGTIAGGGGGAIIGGVLGGGLGAVLGGVGGALLGRGLDKQHTRERNGC
jgi:hypothetical protein